MEKSSKRGKIPQSDWPLIMARYEAGETLSSIARTYDCSPPAISYVISRSRARHPDGETARPPAPVSEPQLIKAVAGDGSAGGSGRPQPAATTAAVDGITGSPHGETAPVQVQPAVPPVDPQGDRRIEIRPQGNGFARPIGGEREPLYSAPFMRPAPLPAPRPAVPNQPIGPANGDQ